MSKNLLVVKGFFSVHHYLELKYLSSLIDYDTKVKEGEELLARLLGKVKLNESL